MRVGVVVYIKAGELIFGRREECAPVKRGRGREEVGHLILHVLEKKFSGVSQLEAG